MSEVTKTTSPRSAILVGTEDWFVALHWLPLIRAISTAGYRVLVATRVRQHADAIAAAGAEVVPLRLAREGRNPLGEGMAIQELTALYRRVRPTVVHHLAMKPILYGTLAARRAGVATIVNTFPGLGHLYVHDSPANRAKRWLLEGILGQLFHHRGVTVQVQNEDDRAALVAAGVIDTGRIQNIGGVGVALAEFVPRDPPADPAPLVIFPARMLRDKGVHEFVAAAEALKAEKVPGRFVLVGDTDVANPSAVPAAQLLHWAEGGAVEWWGHREDMPAVFGQAAIVVLPSFYREGVPKSLQEAAASARAIITTDVPGCRDAVRHGWNGLIVPPRDVAALTAAMGELLTNSSLRSTMGVNGRLLAEERFDDVAQARGMISQYPI